MRFFPRQASSYRPASHRRFSPRLELLEERTLLAADPLLAQFQSAGGLLSLHGDSSHHVVTVSLTSGGFVQLSVAGHLYSSNPQAANYDSGLAGATGQTLQAIGLDGDAGADHLILGNLNLAGGLAAQSDGILDVQGVVRAAGPVQLSGPTVLVAGQMRADGAAGGSIAIMAGNVLQSGRIEADGHAGRGGSVQVDFTGHYVATAAAVTEATGTTAGGSVVVAGGASGTLFSSGQYRTSSTGGVGGDVDLFGQQVHLVGATVDASGKTGGGWARVGGDSPSDLAAHGGAVAGVSLADTTTVSAGTTLTASALGAGDGGRIVVWSQDSTTFGGTLRARGAGPAGHGGLLEVSSAGLLTYGGHADAAASSGKNGQLLLDPKNIVISNGVGLPQFNLLNPLPGAADTFGASVVTLSNGNVVVTDPTSGLAGANTGAAFLYDGHSGALLATLTGTTSGDQIGSGGVTALTNGNFVVSSPTWQIGGAAVGAATWMSGSASATAVVSASNSLVGSTAGDNVSVGDQQAGSNGVLALANGNFVVISPFWQLSGARVGAVTWGNGFVGSAGPVTANNSLVGSVDGDQVGSQGATALTNGNYVVSSPNWQQGGGPVGAATWGNGLGGTVGPVSATNSLVGTVNEGSVATGGAVALANGNYVVVSPGWDNGNTLSVGAVTWGNGFGGTAGPVSVANSTTGSTGFDSVGQGGVTALANGNYVIASPLWQSAGFQVGAVTWAKGDGSAAGQSVSSANSLVGATGGDQVGSGGATALTNGNYVVSSPNWQDAAGIVGAATWVNGTTGQTLDSTGTVSAANSLVGSTSNDQVAAGNGNPGSGATALPGGAYVVSSPSWQNAGMPVGAVTWAKANGTTVGAITAANSLVGATSNDQVGSGGVTVLTNGNFVVSSPSWHNGNAVVGAVTWAKADGSTVGAVGTANSLVGSTSNDHVGSGGITVLAGGNYVVDSPGWQRQGKRVGAATWVNGSTGQTVDAAGSIDTLNSLIGPGSGAALSQVVGLPAGNAFLAALTNNGGSVTVVQTAASTEAFATAATQTITLTPSFLTATLNTGTAVLLQASNDITVSSPILVSNPNGPGGNLTLDAGRQLLILANINTGNGNLTLIANDAVAAGVIDSQRDTGAAAITMGAGTSLTTGTGNLTVTLGIGANTNFASDDITLGDVTAHNVTLANFGPGDTSIGGTGVGSGVDMASVNASGNLIVQSTGDITQRGALGPNDPGTLTVAGTTRLTAVNLITLNNPQNAFAGTVTYADPGGEVTLAAAGNLTLSAIGAADSLTATAGGILTTGDLFAVSGASSFSAASLRLTGAQTRLQGPVSLSSAGSSAVTTTTPLTVADLTLAGPANLAAPTITFAGALNVGSQTLTVTTSGPAHLNGTTTLAGGTLSDSAGLVVGSGATLGGFGTLQAGAAAVATQIGATLAPATTGGGLVVNGDLTLAPVSVLAEQLLGTSQFSQLTVSGAVSLNNATLQIGIVNPYVPAKGDQFPILAGGPSATVSGNFTQGTSVTVGPYLFGIAYGTKTIGLTVNAAPGAPVIAVPGPQTFFANKSIAIPGVNVTEPTVQFGPGMTVQATLSVQNGTLTLGNTFLLSFTQGSPTGSSTLVFTGLLAYVDLALATLTYLPAQDTAQPDTLTVTINDLGNAGAGQPLTTTKTVSLIPASGALVVADPVLTGKQDLVFQGTPGNDVVTINPGKVASSYVVTSNGVAQTVTGVTGRILAFDSAGNNTITLSRSLTLPALFVVGNGNNTLQGDAATDTFTAGNGKNTITGGTGANTFTLGNGNNTVTGGSGANTFTVGNGTNTLTGGAGNDTFTAGTGSNRIDGGGGVNTLIESGNVDFTLLGGTSRANGTLTKGANHDTLVFNRIQKVQLALTGPDSHKIDATGFTGPETLLAGTGNDTLLSGAGNDILVGGTGNDVLTAGNGTNLIIAGKGAATITGGTGADLIIGGTTAFDANVAALSAIMAEWTGGSSYAVKIKHLTGAQSGGLNGTVKLTSATVLNNTHVNKLTGGKGVDWFWASALDQITDLNNGGTETVNPIS